MSKAMRRRVSDASPWVPEDMVGEILSWLPVKSLLRFKCVCKRWNQLIEQDDFVEMHHRHAAMRFYIKRRIRNMGREWQLADIFRSCIDIQKGLLLEHEHEYGHEGQVPTERLRIRNPWTRQTVYLPDLRVSNEPRTWVVARMFFVAKECTVISFSGLEESVSLGRFRAVTVGVDAAWRPLKNSPPNSTTHCNISSNVVWDLKIYAQSIENIFYVVVTMDANYKKILWVNAEDESIKTAKIPENLFSDWSHVMPREWNSKLCLSCHEGDQINICVLMNNSNNEWAKTLTVDVATFTLDYPIPFITQENKIWFTGINEIWSSLPWFNNKEKLSVKPTVLQLKGMQSDKVEEAFREYFWKERDMPKTTSQFISVISLERL